MEMTLAMLVVLVVAAAIGKDHESRKFMDLIDTCLIVLHAVLQSLSVSNGLVFTPHFASTCPQPLWPFLRHRYLCSSLWSAFFCSCLA
jgi:hypothetical protein